MIRKIGLIIFGIFLIALIELSLRLPAKFIFYTRSLRESQHTNKAGKVIYCIGDSHTFGVGTSYKYSYPRQLQELLNLNNPETTFKVINLGIPGESTGQQIERLSNLIVKNRVHMVILLTGRNNHSEIAAGRNKSFVSSSIVKIKKMKIYKIMEHIANNLRLKPEEQGQISKEEIAKYEDYLRRHLIKAKYLCKKYNCRLLVLSYYNSSDGFIEKITKQSGILYFDLSQDFSKNILREGVNNFLSPDKSHLNRYGYKLFAELLYGNMFLHRTALGLSLEPLSNKISASSFYQNRAEINDALNAQENRIKNMPYDPFELVHLGHIYMEIREIEKAKDWYLKALEVGNFMDNNTIISPIINLYLGQNMPEEAYKICQRIILVNKNNNIAKSYLAYIKEKYKIYDK